MKNASSPFEFNSDAAAQGPSNPERYNAMSPAGRSPRRGGNGKRAMVAGMTSISLALAGLTVPSVVGDEPLSPLASAQENNNRGSDLLVGIVSNKKGDDIEIVIQEDPSTKTFTDLIFSMREGDGSTIINTETAGRSYPTDAYTFDEVQVYRNGKYQTETGFTASLIKENPANALGQEPYRGPLARITFSKPVATSNGTIKLIAKGANAKGAEPRWPFSGGAQSSGLTKGWVPVDTGTVSGRVTDPTGNGVAGVTVTAGGKTATTDANGNYSIAGVPTGSTSISVVRSSVPAGYSVSGPLTRNVTTSGLSGIDFSTTRETGTVSGRVTDPSGNGVAGVTVTAGGKTAVTDVDGYYSIAGVPTGSVSVAVSDGVPAGYSVSGAQQENLTTSGVSGVDFSTTRETGTVSGRITDDKGNGVGGVTVTIGGKSATTNPDGTYTIDEVPAGQQDVEVSGVPEGYTPSFDSSVDVKPDGSTPSVDVKLAPIPTSSPATTSATNPTTSAPKPAPTTKPTTSAPKPAPTATKATTSKPTTSAPKPTAAPDPTTDSKPEPKKPSIVGTITDPEGNPLPPAKDKDGKPQPPTVTIKDKDGNQVVDPIEVDENGNFEVPELPEGDYVVIVDAPEGFNDPKPQVVPVKDSETTELPPITVTKPSVDLDKNKPAPKPGSINGWLIDDSNRPIPGAEIRLVKKGVTDPETGEKFDYEVPLTVDADGYFVTPPIDFKYFPEGTVDFDLEITLPEGWPDEDVTGAKLNRTVTVTQGEPTNIGEIKVKAPQTQSIVGRVDDGNGNAVPGTVVVVTDPRGNSRVIPVEDDGSFKIDDLIPGVHEVEILTPGRDNNVDPIKVPVRAGEDVELPTIHLTKNTSLKLEKRVWGRDADNNGKIKNEDGELVDDVMTVKDGEDLPYALIVTNDGDEPISNITFDDPELRKRNIELTMPEGWTAESQLMPGDSRVFSATMKAPEDAFDFNNVATANGVTATGEKVSSLPDSAYTKFMRGEVEKKVNARFATNPDKPVSAKANSALGFTYEVKNSGFAPMVNVTLTDIVYEDGVDEDNCVPGEVVNETGDIKCYELEVKAPEGFDGTLLPGQRVIFTADIPEGLKPGAHHHNAAEARGELQKLPNRGDQFEGEPDYGEDPSSVLIISPRENLKGNAHIVVSEGAALATDVTAVTWVDKNGNGKQDAGQNEHISGLEVSLVPTDGSPAILGTTGADGNVLFEGAPQGEYTIQIKSPGNLRLADPKDPEKNSFEPGAILESKPFNVDEKERIIDLRMEAPRTDVTSAVTQQEKIDSSSDLGKCLATASSVSNPVAWLVPIGLLTAVMGGIGVMFEDELNAAAAQANEAVRRTMPNVNLGLNFQQPEWMREIQGQWQAQIDQVNRQLAQINPAAPAAAAGVGVIALAGLLTGLYYASCELGWNEPSEEGSSSHAQGSSSKTGDGVDAEAEKGSSSSSGSSEKAAKADTDANVDKDADQPAESAN